MIIQGWAPRLGQELFMTLYNQEPEEVRWYEEDYEEEYWCLYCGRDAELCLCLE